jgi:hypothetical protein
MESLPLEYFAHIGISDVPLVGFEPIGAPLKALEIPFRNVSERECEEVTSPALGSVSVSGRNFGDKAVYSCEPGYHLVGLKERLCRGDGNWSGSPATCKQNGKSK